MAETVTGSVVMRMLGTSIGSAGGAALSAILTQEVEEVFATGTGDDQVDVLWTRSGTLGASGSDSFDLEDGTEDQPLGTAAEFDELLLLLVRNTGAGDLELAGNLLGFSSEGLPVEPGGFALIYMGTAGRAVTASTADTLGLSSTAGTDYVISGLGRSA